MFAKKAERIIHKDRDSLSQATIFACLSRFLPTLSRNEYEDFIKDVLINQSIAWNEQGDLNALSRCNIIGASNVADIPSIYCSFHYSSFRLCLSYLLKKKIPIVLLASSDVIKQQGKFIYKTANEISSGTFGGILDANAPYCLRNLIREIRNGKSVFVYLDGNTGADGMTINNKNLVEIPFLGSSLLVRKGIAALSYTTKTPLVPIIASTSRTGDKIIEIFPAFKSWNAKQKDDYCRYFTTEIYSNVLEKKLANDARQWETWLYLHNFLVKEKRPVQNRNVYFFNHREFDLIHNDNHYYIFCFSRFNGIEIEKDIYITLKEGFLDKNQIDSDLLTFFIIEGVLI